MGQVIKIKHSTTTGNKPASLASGELAINVSDGNLFFGDGSNVQNYLHLGTTTASTMSITKTLVVTGQTDLHSNLVMNSNKITSLLDPTTSQDAATKAYVDSQTGGAISNYLPLSGGTMSGVIAMGTNKVTGVGNPTLAQDAATKAYVDQYATSGVSSVAISGSDGIQVDSGSPITSSGTIALGLSAIDATKIADGTVTNEEFQFINTLSSNAQNQITDNLNSIETNTVNIGTKLPLAGGTVTGALNVSGVTSFGSNLVMDMNKITGVANPISAQDAATKGYVDGLSGATDNFQEVTNNGNTTTNAIGIGSSVAPSYQLDVTGDIHSSTVIRSSGLYSTFGSFSSNINANGNIIGDGTTNITGINNITATGAVSISGLTSVGDNIIMNSNKITSLLNPTELQDAATKSYVDSFTPNGLHYLPLSGGTVTGALNVSGNTEVGGTLRTRGGLQLGADNAVSDYARINFGTPGNKNFPQLRQEENNQLILDRGNSTATLVEFNTAQHVDGPAVKITGDIDLDSGYKLYLDSGSDTYITDGGLNNNISLYANNTNIVNFNGVGTVIAIPLNVSGATDIDGTLNVNANLITNVTNPTSAQDAATKAYVDQYATSGVSSVAALTLGTSGTDLSSTVANGTTTPVITLNVPTASASNRGVLSSSDWTTFNNKTTNTGTVESVSSTTAGDALDVAVSNSTTTPAIALSWAGSDAQYIDGEGNLTTFPTLPVGDVTAVLSGSGIVVTNSSGPEPSVAIDYVGTNNPILVATTATPVGGDNIWFSDTDDNTIKKATISSFPGFGKDGTVTDVSSTTGGDALDVAVSNSTTTPAIALSWAGEAAQYIDGTGNLITFPAIPQGDVTGVGSGTGIIVSNSTGPVPSVAIDYSDDNNFIYGATNRVGDTISEDDIIVYVDTSATPDTVVRGAVSDLPFTDNTGTVTSVAALTLGTSGTDLSSSVANGTTSAVVTLNVPTASASNRGALSSTDWSTFNSKTTNTGTVTSVAVSGSDGIDVDSGSPIVSGGTIALGLSNVPNSSLLNSSVTITAGDGLDDGGPVALGGTVTLQNSDRGSSQLIFKNVASDSGTAVADTNNDTLSIVGGTNVTTAVVGDTLTINASTQGDITAVDGGTYITTTSSTGPVPIVNHDTTSRTDTTSAVSPAHGATFTAVDSVSTNTTGHITALNLKTVTLPDDQDGVTSVSGTLPVVSSGGNTPTISMAVATTSASGYLSSTDWNTFNSKTTNTGTVTSVGITHTGNAFNVGSAVTTSGTLDITMAGEASQYIDGTGNLITFPAIPQGDVTAVDGGTYITTTSSTGPVPIVNHDATSRTDTTSIASPAHGATFTAVDSVSTNATGHITALNLKTVTLPADAEGVTSVSGTAPVAVTTGSTPTVSMAVATTSASGYLTSTDWNTFNNKTTNTGTVTSVSSTTGGDSLDVAVSNSTTTPAIALTWAGSSSQYIDGAGDLTTFPTIPQGDITEVTTSSPITGGGTGGIVDIAIQVADTSQSGYLSNTDWNTFNSKTTNTGTVTSVSGGTGISISSLASVTPIVNIDTVGADNAILTNTVATPVGADTMWFSDADDSTIKKATISTFPGFGKDGTVTSVGSITLGTAGTDLASTVANGTTTPVITLNVPTASASNRGALSSSDWSTFNSKTTNTGTVTDVSSTTAGDALDVAVSNSTTTPEIALTWAGSSSQYIDGAGDLTTFPTIPAGDVTAVDGGTYITTTDSTGPVPVVNHDTTSRTDTTSTVSPAHGATFTSVDSVSTNATGHITALNLKTITLPADAEGVTSVSGTAPVAVTAGATPTVSMAVATTSASGYLTSTDWNTFNSKTTNTGTVESVSSTTGGDALDVAVSNATTTPAIALSWAGSDTQYIDGAGDLTTFPPIPQGDIETITVSSPITGGGTSGSVNVGIQVADTSQSGYLSSTDWNTFNSKTTNTGTVKSVSGGTGISISGAITVTPIVNIDTVGADNAILSNTTETPVGSDTMWFSDADDSTIKKARISSFPGFGADGTVTSVAFVLGVGGTDLTSSVTNGTTTPLITLNIPTASDSKRGVLSSSDWSTFNEKTTNTGTVTSVASTTVGDALDVAVSNATTTPAIALSWAGSDTEYIDGEGNLTTFPPIPQGDITSVDGGTYITTTSSTGPTPVVNHDSTSRTDTTSVTSPAHGDTFTAVDSVSTNATGHITALNLKTVTLPADAEGVTSVSGTAPVSVTAGSTPTVSMAVATTSASGYLSSTDWNTFNSKTTNTGTVKSVSGGTGISISGAITVTPIVNIDTVGADNAILSNTVATPVGADTMWFSDADDSTIKKATISTFPGFGRDGTVTDVSSTTGGDGLDVAVSNSTTTPAIALTWAGDDTQYIDGAGDLTTFPSIPQGDITAITVSSPITGGGTTGSVGVGIQVADTSQSGYLSSTDWNTFNSKTTNTGTVTSVASITLGTSGTDLSSTIVNGTTTPVITLNVPTASASNRGALSSSDWSTFNSKTNNTGTVTSVSSTTGGDSLDVAVSNSTTTPAIALTWAGSDSQYIDGEGNLTTFPAIPQGDITSVTAGDGLGGGGATGDVTLTNTDKGSSQLIFKNVASDSGTAVADTNNDTLSIVGGTNVTTAVVGDTLTINASTQGDITAITVSSPITGGGTTGSVGIAIQQSSGSQAGYLSASDWDTFNSKTDNTGTVRSVASTTAGDALDVTVSNSTTTPAIALTWDGSSSQYIDGEGNLTTFPTIPQGDITGVGSGTGIIVSNSTGPVPSVAIDYEDDNNFIYGAADRVGVAISDEDIIAYVDTSATPDTVVRGAVGDLPFTNNVGDITAITVTGPITGGGTSGSVGIAITQSSASASGYLSSTDWSTFNSKTNNTGTVTSVASITLGTSGTDLSSSVANGSTTPVITLNVPTASASNRGALSSTDWSTFNSKTSNTGTVTSVTTMIDGDAITINSSNSATITTSGTFDLEFAGTSSQYIDGEGTLTTFPTIPAGDVTAVDGGTYITTTSSTGPVPIVNHDATSRTDTTSTVSPAHGATFTSVDSVSTNATGHITALNLKTVTLPADAEGVTSVSGTAPVVSSGGNTPTISMAVASTSANGYLSSTDWNTFNSKTTNTGTVTSVSSTTGGDALDVAVSNATTTPAIALTWAGDDTQYIDGAGDVTTFPSIPQGDITAITVSSPITGGGTSGSVGIAITQSSASASGYLSSTDWSTFNNKTNNTGTVTSVSSTTGGDALDVAVSNSTSTPAIALTWAGADTEYIDGTGDLVTFPSIPQGDITAITVTGPITGGGTSGSVGIAITQSSASASGYLSSTDWSTFNSKTNNTGTVRSVSQTHGGDAFTVGGSPIIGSGTLAITMAGSSSQYIDGEGNLTTFPSIPQGDITSVTAGDGLGGGGTSGDVTLTNADKGSSQLIFKNVASDSGTAVADTNNDTLSIVGGTNVTTAVVGDTLTINASTQGDITAITVSSPITGGGTSGSVGVAIQQSSGSQAGYLSSTDWTTFNSKTTNTGTVTSVAALTLGTSGTDLSSSVANGSTSAVVTLNVPTASASNRGALSSTDWSTFNSKTNNTGTVTSVSSTTGGDGLDVAVSNSTSTPAIALTWAGDDTQYIDGAGNLTAFPTIPSGDVTAVLAGDGIAVTNSTGPEPSVAVNSTVVRTSGTQTIAGLKTFSNNVELANTADLKFVDLAGTFPTSGKGFDWTLNNDGARIYAIQPSSDSIDLTFELRDNATTNDRFVFHVNDYRGVSEDKYPLIIRGGTQFDLVDSALYTDGTIRLSNSGVLSNVTNTNWDAAFNDKITGFADSGSDNITLTLTQQDGGTLTTSFANPQGTVTQVAATTAGDALDVAVSNSTTNPSIALTWDGSSSQYIDGAGDLTTFPSIPQGDITAITVTGPITGGGTSGSVGIAITQSSASASGYLSSTDWTTFNNKTTNTGTVTSVSSSTGGDALDVTVSNSTSTPAIALTWAGADTEYIDGAGNLTTFPSIPQGDITSVTAGDGLGGGGTSGDVTLTNADKGSSQLIFKNVASDSGTAVADTNNDTLSIVGGTNVTTAVVGDTLTINASTQGDITAITVSSPITGGGTTGSVGIAITQSSASASGYLSSTDWTTFNNKTTNTGTVTSVSSTTGGDALDVAVSNSTSTPAIALTWAGDDTEYIDGAGDLTTFPAIPQGDITAITVTGPITGGGTSGSVGIAITQSSASASGYLSSTDWTTFNNKTTNTGTVTSVGITHAGDAFNVGSSVTTSGTLDITMAGSSSQYIDGEGTLTTFPSIPQGDITAITVTGPITGGGTSGSVGIAITQSSASASGYLSSTDWSTFNSKTNNTGTVTSVASLTLGTSGTDLSSSVANGTTSAVVTLNVPTASASNRGALSSSDWTTFNNKTSNTGTVTSVSSTTGGDALDVAVSNSTSTPAIALTWAGSDSQYIDGAGDLTTFPSIPQGDITAITVTGPITGGGTSGSVGIAITQSSASASGYLSSTDWSTFNSKTNNTGTVTSVSSTTGGDALDVAVSNSTSTPAIALTWAGADTEYIDGTGDLVTFPSIPQGDITAITVTGPITGGGTSGSVGIAITQSSASASGYLSSTDWSTFNSKTNNTGTVTSVAALTLGTSGTDLSSSVANGSTSAVVTLNVPTASASNRGALSSSDWTTFNNKTSNTGTVTSVSSTTGGDALDVAVSNSTSTPAIALSWAGSDTEYIDGEGNLVTFPTIPAGDVTAVDGGTYITTTSSTGPVPVVNHDATSRTDTTSTVSPAHGATFTAVDSVSTNATGHITALNLKTVTLPADAEGVTSVTGTAPVVSSGGNTPAISMPVASTTVDGYLSSTDWNTFNNKTTNTGTVTSVAVSGSDGIDVDSGSPITTNGTIALGLSDVPNSSLENSSVTVTPGTLLDNGGSVSLGGSITLDVDLSELATSTSDGDGDFFAVIDSANAQKKLTKGNINNSGFNNDAGYTTNAGTVTSVSSTTGGDGLDVAVSNSTTTPAIALTWAGSSSQYIDGAGDLTTFPSIPQGDITAITVSSPITGGGTTGSVGIAITQSSASASGYLSSTDWSTFNSKTNNTGTVTSVAALTLGTSGTDLSSSVANGTTSAVVTLNVPTASASNRGALSSSDWSTFNSKTNNTGTVTSVAALTLGTSGTDLSSTVANGSTSAVVTLNIPTASASNRGALSSSDWTAFNNKTSNAGTVTSVGTTGNVNGITLTGGDITSSGTITLGGTLGSIGNSQLTNSAINFGGVSLSLGGSDTTPAFNLSDATGYLGDSSLRTTGTITSGVWASDRLFTVQTSEGQWEGDYVTFGAAVEEELQPGTLYYFNGLTWIIADASSVSSSTGMLAIALGNAPSDGMLIRGMYGTLSYDPGNKGDILYVSELGGKVANSAPTTASAVVRVVGYAMSNTAQLWFNPDNTWVELAS